MQKTKSMGTGTALAVAILSFGIFAGVASLVTENRSHITPVSLANDDEDGEDSKDSSSESDKKDEEKSKEADKKQSEQAKESAKKQSEQTREAAKQQSERTRESDKQQSELLKGSESDDNGDNNSENEGDENGLEDDNDADNVGGDNNGMFKDENKTLSHLNEKLAEAEKHILEKQAEGMDVTTALANLALAKSKLTQVKTSFTANDLESAKELSKEIEKQAHFTEKDIEFAKDAAESVADVTKKFGKVSKKIASFEALGGDASVYKTQLASLQADFATLQGSGAMTRETVKAFEKKAERLKSLVERSAFALGGTDGDDLFSDHEEDANDLEDDLNDVAEIEDGDENGVAKKVKAVALEHKVAGQDIKKNLEDIQNRGGLERLLLGADANALDGLTVQTTAMTTRADALAKASEQITDPQIKQILVDQVAALRSEAAKLQAYVSSEGNQFSIFGKLLSFFR